MKKLLHWVGNFICDESGPTALEYGVLTALIVASMMVVITAFSNAHVQNCENINATITDTFNEALK